MSLRRYPEYQESGIEWAEELPSHWRNSRLKWLCNRYSGGTPDKNRVDYWEDGTIPWLNSGAVNDGRIYEPSAYITQEAFERSSAKWIPTGSLLMALAGQGKTKGMVAQLMFESTCNQSMAAIVPSSEINSRFLYWWLACNYQNIRNMAGGDLRDGLNLELLGEITCPLPLDAEQSSIADFLDRETANIDALISEQEKLLALLAEKRQATISHAVTRGINPDVPLKDSGVNWLGKVPAHWDFVALKWLVIASNAGEVIDRSHWGGDLELLYTCALEPMQCDYFGFPDAKRTRENDLLVTRNGSPYVHKPILGSIYTNVVQRISLMDSIDRDFAAIALQNSANNLKGYGVSIESLNYEMWGALVVGVPPIQEQKEIVSRLSRKLESLDELRVNAELQVHLLKERRSALITAAVTGQFDVRGRVEVQAA